MIQCVLCFLARHLGNRSNMYFALSILCAAVAMFSKEQGVTVLVEHVFIIFIIVILHGVLYSILIQSKFEETADVTAVTVPAQFLEQIIKQSREGVDMTLFCFNSIASFLLLILTIDRDHQLIIKEPSCKCCLRIFYTRYKNIFYINTAILSVCSLKRRRCIFFHCFF